jgi:hypothetical protein
MADDGTRAAALLREVDALLAQQSGLVALRTASCPTLQRCAQVFTDPKAGWTESERTHFRACSYCYGVGQAFIKATRNLPPAPLQAGHSPLAWITKLLRVRAPKRTH